MLLQALSQVDYLWCVDLDARCPPKQKVSTVASVEGCDLRIYTHVGVASANMGQTLKENEMYLSRQSCGSFCHLVFTVLVMCLMTYSMRILYEITGVC